MATKPEWLLAASLAGLDFVARNWARAEKQEGAWFDAPLADAIVELWPRLFRHTEGEWADRPFHLTEWQACIVRLLVGWRRADGTRVFRRMLLWVARKNGKTEFIAALALLFWILDGEKGGQAYAIASKEAQAKLPFEKAKTMIRFNPDLSSRITINKSSLWLPELFAKFEVLTGNAGGKHGLSASVIVGDEIHEWRDLVLYTTLHQSIAARSQPIELLASTAGMKGFGCGFEVFTESHDIDSGVRDDPEALIVIFAALPEDDWTDETIWKKANPNLGISPKISYLRSECAKAKDNPRLENDFRRYHLNQWTEQNVRWLPMTKWDACSPDENWKDLEKQFHGRSCYGGLDLSSTRDITALVWVFPPAGDELKWTILPRFWVPAESIELRARVDRVDYDIWAKSGAIFETVGNVVDYAAIRSQVKADTEKFAIESIAIDRWNATGLAVELAEDGCTVEMFGQGFASMSAPSKEFERLVFAELLNHGRHPALRWMAGNVAIATDPAGNIKPAKNKAAEKIDGIVAAIMGIGLATKATDLTSVYETRGVRTV